jgi:hypothetical protein
MEELIKLILDNPDNINIQYSNINGQEKLVVNGKEIIATSERVKQLVDEYKERLQKLDDELFTEFVEQLEEVMDLQEFDKLLNKEEFTEDDPVIGMIDSASYMLDNLIMEKISHLKELLNY